MITKSGVEGMLSWERSFCEEKSWGERKGEEVETRHRRARPESEGVMERKDERKKLHSVRRMLIQVIL